jgi:hypothetical protein
MRVMLKVTLASLLACNSARIDIIKRAEGHLPRGQNDGSVRATTSRASETVEQSDARVHDKELKLIHPERLRQCSSEMPDYMIR